MTETTETIEPETTPVKKGDRFRAMGAEVEVRRVSGAGTWADITVTQASGASWRKRQPLPFPDGWKKQQPVQSAVGWVEFDWTIHPGVTWREAVDEADLSQAEIARQMGISEKHLSQILTCTVMPGVEATVAFSRTMNLPVHLMWNLACNHKLALALGKKDLTADYL